MRIGGARGRQRRDERRDIYKVAAGAMILAIRGRRVILTVAAGPAVMGAKGDLRSGADGGRQVRGGGGGVIGATKVKRRQQQREQSRENRAIARRAPPRLRQSTSRRRGRVAPPGAIYTARTQSLRPMLVNILDELSVYDWLRAGCKTKLARLASISASALHSARLSRAS
jgi:hypothetical protein